MSVFKLLNLFPFVLQLSNSAEGGCLVNSIPSKDGRVDWSQVNFLSMDHKNLLFKDLFLFEMKHQLQGFGRQVIGIDVDKQCPCSSILNASVAL